MKAFALIFTIMGLLVIPLGIAGASIFESGMQFEARVKAIAVNKDIKVKFEDLSKSKGDREVFLSLCLSRASGNNGRLLKSESMELIRSAMKTGQKIRIGYSSLFDRCIKSVELIQENKDSDKRAVKTEEIPTSV